MAKKKKKALFGRLDFSKPFPVKYKIQFILGVVCIVSAFVLSGAEVFGKFESSDSLDTVIGFMAIYGIIGPISALINFIIWKIGNSSHRAKAKREADIQAAQLAAQQAAQEQERKRIATFAGGKWPFPDQKLYKICIQSGIENLNSDFAVKKALAVAQQLLNDANMPPEYHGLYVSPQNIASRFEHGKLLELESTRLKELHRRTPKQGELAADEVEKMALAQKLKPLYGTAKRNFILDDLIKKSETRITQLEEGQKAMRELSLIMGTSAYQEKKKDWAVLGGIADGIAGPGAGLAVAANAMAENCAIEQRNRQNQQAVSRMAAEMYSNSMSLSDDIGQVQRELNAFQRQRRESGMKVVLEQYTAEEIFKKLKITTSVTKTDNSKGLKLNVSIKSNFKPDVPDSVKTTVDGTLTARIYFAQTPVSTVCVPLPLFGVSDYLESVTAYSDQYVEADGEFTVDIVPNKLWVMEL